MMHENIVQKTASDTLTQTESASPWVTLLADPSAKVKVCNWTEWRSGSTFYYLIAEYGDMTVTLMEFHARVHGFDASHENRAEDAPDDGILYYTDPGSAHVVGSRFLQAWSKRRGNAHREKKPAPSVLQEAESLINGDRQASYGEPALDFAKTAELASAMGFRMVGHDGKIRKVENYDVPLFQVAVKISRMKAHPENWHHDSVVDAAGYLGTLEKVKNYDRDITKPRTDPSSTAYPDSSDSASSPHGQ